MMMSEVSGYVTSYPYNVTLGLFVAGTAAFALRRYMAGDVCYSKASLEDKTVVITGANTGIGLETAVDMAQRGAKVILACRSPEKGKAAVQVVKERSKNEAVVFSQLDLASLQSVRDFATSILNQEPRIDILINNAGVMVPPYTKTEDGFELQFGVNHLAHFLLTNLLLDRLKEAPAARIVNVSSEAHKQGTINFDDLQLEKSYSRFGGYSQSKLANILFTRSLAQRLKDTNVTAYALCPGPTNTGFAQHLNGFLVSSQHQYHHNPPPPPPPLCMYTL